MSRRRNGHDDEDNELPTCPQTTVIYCVALIIFAAVCFPIYWIGGSWAGVGWGWNWAWELPNTVQAGLKDVYFIFVWAAVLSIIIGTISVIRREPQTHSPGTVLGRGLWLSLHAGVFEEMIWRWMLLLSAPVVLKLLNVITFGLVKWFHAAVLLPVANWATLGFLEEQLLTTNWLIGASVLYAAASFRDAHKRPGFLGFLGWVNSWFMGMVMFYLLFNHGLVTAMVAHFLYDAIVFVISAVVTALRPQPYGLFLRR